MTEQNGTIKIIQIGAGSMGRGWLRTIAANPDVELVGLVDLDVDLARRSAQETGHGPVPVATAVDQLQVDADAVVNVTIPEAHAPTTVQALFAGYPVLCEKPIAPTVATGLQMAAAAETAGHLLMISQSRRYFNAFSQLRQLIGELGAIGSAGCEFFKAPHFGGFRDQMEQPLLVDMAIHTFDAARALLGNPVSVYCETHNPSWSWYRGDASAQAIFEFTGGVRFSYLGSWCAPGAETSWNGQWRISGEHGTALWDGDHPPTLDLVDAAEQPAAEQPAAEQPAPEQIAGSLAEFVRHLRTGTRPDTVAEANVLSLAMVEAAVTSAATGRRVELTDVIDTGYTQAVTDLDDSTEQGRSVLKTLTGWDARTKVGL